MRDRKEILMERMNELRKLTLHAANELNNECTVKRYCASESGIEIVEIIQFYLNEMKDIAMELDNK